MLTINALTAAKEVLIPMAMELLALRGLDMLSQTIGKIRAITNPDLQYLGMLPTKYDKTTLNSKEIYSALQASAHNAGIRVFNTYIPLTCGSPNRPGLRLPLSCNSPTMKAQQPI
jgi:chromosome partitioning protein